MANAPGPASADAIAALPMKNLDDNSLGPAGKGECLICMDDVYIGDEVVSLPCAHWFHETCAGAWLSEHNLCPICRKAISGTSQKDAGARIYPGIRAIWPEPQASAMPFTRRAANSRAGSTSSRTSNNGRNRISKSLSRRESTQEDACAGFQVYDSRSTHSASSSIGSAASTGRRGPLSSGARAMANIIKSAKACWRCKFMRKPVNYSTLCVKDMLTGTSVILNSLATLARRDSTDDTIQLGLPSDVDGAILKMKCPRSNFALRPTL
jgi:hypothetical protein